MKMKLLLFDLDGTLLNSEKQITEKTRTALQMCRRKGMLLGVSTSRGETNCLKFLKALEPDILVASGGAVVKHGAEYIYKAEISAAETRAVIAAARSICGADCMITVDTLTEHYWNYSGDPKALDAKLAASWGDVIYTDYAHFDAPSLKISVEIPNEEKAAALQGALPAFDMLRFSDGCWYKLTRAGVTKERAIQIICDALGITLEDVTAFGDDFPDIGMLKLCGVGVAMGNAIDAVKEIADIVIGGNDEDGIAAYISEVLLAE